MATTQIEQFWHNLVADIKSNRVVLPALPEVALKVRKLLDNRSVTSAQIAKAMGSDMVLTTRLLRVVNSPLYRTHSQIEDVKTAITRLGNANVRSLITSLAMEQLYQSKLASPFKKRVLAQNWDHSIHVAALSHVIAERYTGLKPDEAMLAGLIHDIGKLPILEYSEMLPDLMDNEQLLEKIIRVLHTKVGMLILKSWKFPEEIVTVAAEHENLERDPGTDADYTDVVIISNLLSYIGTEHPYTKLDWSTIPAFTRLALTPEESIDVIRDAREEIAEVKKLFTL